MPTNTANLNLFKYGSTDGARTFNIDEALNANWDKIDEAVAKKYTKAPTGIPELDLDSAVKAALGKARTALQSVTKADVGLGNVDNTSDASKPISNAQAAKFSEVEGALTTHQADNVTHDTYVSCATASATAEKVVTANGFTLVEGARITVKFANANTATTPTLKINTELAKPLVKADGTAFKNIKAGIYSFVYSGASFTLLGEGGEYGTATASDVRKAKTFGTENGVQQGTLDLANLVSGNLKKGVTIDGITGTLDVAALGGKKYSSGTGITDFSNGSFSIASLTFTPSVIYVFDTHGTYAIYFFGNRTSNGINMNFSSVTSNGFSIATTVYSWSFTWIAYE